MIGRRLHDENRFRFQLAGGDPEDWPDYEGSEEEQFTAGVIEDIEAGLSVSPLVRRPAE